jgi:DNA-binding beta-propeller fold protein YncE
MLALVLVATARPGHAETEIVVGSSQGVRVFARTASGDAAPIRQIQRSAPVSFSGGVAVDSTNHEVFVPSASENAIHVFSRTANGRVAPIRTLQGPLTGLEGPFGMFVDTVHDELYVADGGNDVVLVFPRTAHGNVAPIRRIQNHNLDATGFFAQLGVLVDHVHDEVLVSGTKLATDAILVFPRLANGTNVLPIREIPGGFNNFLEGMFVNHATDEIFATSGQTAGEIRVYPRTANAPITTTTQMPAGFPTKRAIKGAATGLNKPVGLAVDVANGEIIVTSSGNHSVRVFPISADGNVAPLRVIEGAATGLASPQMMALAAVPAALPEVLLASVLPASRSVQMGTAASAFATILNTGAAPLANCEIGQLTGPALSNMSFVFQTTDPATNQVVGSPNAPVSIPGNALQTFVFAFTPALPAFPPTDIQLAFQCAGAALAPIAIGLDTLLLSASATPVPDVIALAATAGNNGIVDIPGPGARGAFAVATANVGAAGLMTVSADTGEADLPLALTVCQTDAAGLCQSEIGPAVTAQIDAGQTSTFSVFATALDVFVFDPANHRVFLRVVDQTGVTRGATSVAARLLSP